MKGALFLVLFSLVSGVVVNYGGNVSLSNGDDFAFRATGLAGFSSGVYSGSVYKSISIGDGSSSGYFSVFYGGLLLPPTQYASYYLNSASFDSTATNPATISLTSSSSFIGTVYLNLQEIDPSGALVETVDFASNGAGQLQWTSTVNAGNGGLRTSVYSGVQGPLNINLTVVYSDVLGTLDVVGSPIVTPLSAETIVEIGGYVYGSNANHLRLNMAVASAEVDITNVGTGTVLASGAGSSGANFIAGNTVSTDGKQSQVNVTVTAGATSDLNNQILATQLVAAIKAKPTVHTVKVDFPAGAKHITWDPSVGAGSNPPNMSSAQGLGASVITVLMGIFIVSLI